MCVAALILPSALSPPCHLGFRSVGESGVGSRQPSGPAIPGQAHVVREATGRHFAPYPPNRPPRPGAGGSVLLRAADSAHNPLCLRALHATTHFDRADRALIGYLTEGEAVTMFIPERKAVQRTP